MMMMMMTKLSAKELEREGVLAPHLASLYEMATWKAVMRAHLERWVRRSARA